jgi:hypothetical protein
MDPRWSSLRLILLLVIAWGGSTALRATIIDPQHESRLAQRPDENVLRSPGRDVLSLVSFEHRLANADITWLAIVQELGRAQKVTDAGWDRVERWSEIATDLDRFYFTIYHSAGVTLSVWGKRLDASNRILKKGLAELPNRWELLMVLGYNAYFIAADAKLGSEYMAAASRIEGSPRYLAALAGRMRYHAGDEYGAEKMLEELIPHLEGLAKQDAEARLAMLRSEDRLHRFDHACATYKLSRGTTPKTGEEVVKAGLIAEPAEDLLGGWITFDDKCVARTRFVKVREFEARQRVGAEARKRK